MSRPDPMLEPRPRTRALSDALALLAALLAGLWAAWSLAGYLEVPSGREWDPLAHFLRQATRPVDGIAFIPDWSRGAATDQGRMDGLQTLPLEQALELPPAADLWVVDLRGEQPAPDARRWPHRATIDLEHGARLWHFSESPVRVRDQASLHLDRAVLRVFRPGGKRLLETAPGQLEPSDRPKWHWVRFVRGRFGDTPQRGIRLNPVPGKLRTLSIPRFQVGEVLTVRGGVAGGTREEQTEEGTTEPPDTGPDPGTGQRPAVQLEVRINDVSLARLTFPADQGWQVHEIDTASRAGREAELTLLVQSDAPLRPFLIDATAGPRQERFRDEQ